MVGGIVRLVSGGVVRLVVGGIVRLVVGASVAASAVSPCKSHNIREPDHTPSTIPVKLSPYLCHGGHLRLPTFLSR